MSNTAEPVSLRKPSEEGGLFRSTVCACSMGDDLYYSMERRRMGTAVIINNLDSEQPPTRHDVENMGAVLKDIGS